MRRFFATCPKLRREEARSSVDAVRNRRALAVFIPRRQRRQTNSVKAFSDASSNRAIWPRLGAGRSVAQWATRHGWRVIKDTASGFIADEALSRGAAIAFYTATSLAPVLLIVVAIVLVLLKVAIAGGILGLIAIVLLILLLLGRL